MRRYHSVKDKRIRGQRRKFAKNNNMEYLTEANNMNSKHPLDCGRKMCCMCHSEKILGYKKPRDCRELERFDNMVYEHLYHDHEHDDQLLWLSNYEY